MTHILMKLYFKLKSFHSKICILKFHLQTSDHLVCLLTNPGMNKTILVIVITGMDSVIVIRDITVIIFGDVYYDDVGNVYYNVPW